MVDNAARWSRWLKGKRYDVRAVVADAANTLRITQFEIRVQIRDNQTGDVFDRKGFGRVEDTGKPTYVYFRSKKRLLKEVLEMGDDTVTWSEWKIGRLYDVRVATSDLVASPTQFRVRVEIRDKKGNIIQRSGRATYINPQQVPTYVNFGGKKLHITQLLTLEE